MSKTIYMVRHALIRSNIEDVYSGRSDEELTETGREQAKKVGLEMEDWGISVIYTSPLRRTVQTAEILNERAQARVVVEPDLIEMDLGPWTGLSKREVGKRFPSEYRMWVERPADFRVAGMETLQAIRERVVRAIMNFQGSSTERIAAMVTHAVAIKIAFLQFNNLSLNSYHATPVPNLSVHRITFTDGPGEMERVR